MSCQRNRELIRRHFEGDLKPPQSAKMRDHTRGCPGCMEFYDRVSALEHSLSGSQHHHPVPRSAQRLYLEISAQLLEQPAQLQEHSPAAKPRGVGFWALRLLPASFVLLLLLLPTGRWLSTPGQPEQTTLHYGDSSFTVRGFKETNQAKYGAGVRTFCIEKKMQQEIVQYGVHEISSMEMGEGIGSCPLSGVLFFTASNLQSAPRNFFVFGLDADLRIRWYYPKPTEKASRELAANVLDQPLGRGVVLQVNHQQGAHRIFGVVADRSITVVEVEQEIERLQKSNANLSELDTIAFRGQVHQILFGINVGEMK